MRTVFAYVGPGAGLSVIGTVVAFAGALVFALLGFIWYPLKRLIASGRQNRSDAHAGGKTLRP